MAMKLEYGGIRASLAALNPGTVTGNDGHAAGVVLMLDSDGKAGLCTDPTKALGLAFDQKDSTLNEVDASDMETVVIGPAVVLTDQLASGIGIIFAVNDTVYSDTSGLLSNLQASNALRVGKVLAAEDADGFLKVLLHDPITKTA